MRSVEATGKTVDDAVEKGLHMLGVSRDEVDIEILHPGTTGFLGVGTEPARVRLKVKESPVTFAKRLVEEVVRQAGWDLTVQEPVEREGEIYINMEGRDAGLAIGPKGETLNAFQTILQTALSRRYQSPLKVVLDASNYRERRRGQVVQIALQAADKARTYKKLVRLRNLSAAERRIVHLTLQSDPTVTTFSEGEGDQRVVVVAPAENRQRPRTSPGPSSGYSYDRNRLRRDSLPGSSNQVIE